MYKITNESLILRFFKFIILKVSERNVTFDICKGRIFLKSERERLGARKKRRLLISIKDPFLRLENHGFYLKQPEHFNRLIVRLKEFIMEASQGRLEDFITDIKLEPDEADKKREDEDIKNRKDKMDQAYKQCW